MKRGDIYYADLDPVVGSEQGGTRPVLIIQNNVGNKYSPTTIVAAISSRIKKPQMPIHIAITAEENGMDQDSVILLEQIRTIDKNRLKHKVTTLDDGTMDEVADALHVSLALIPQFKA